mgnify:CR=1 FL=1
MKKIELKKLIKEELKTIIYESSNNQQFKPGLYDLVISPSGDGRDWTHMIYVQISTTMTKIDILQAAFKKINYKFNINDAFAYDLYKIDPKSIRVIRI